LFALGWRGSNRHWQNYEKAYLILAALSTPLVLSVHSIVSFDFATSQLPGWHTTIFPPYFVAGAIFSGFAMVLTLMVPLRAVSSSRPHHDQPPREHEQDHPRDRHDGRLRVRDGVLHRVVLGQPLRALRLHQPRLRPLLVGLLDHGQLQRDHAAALLVQEAPHEPDRALHLSIFVNIGMWFERFVIIVTSLHRDFLPSSWDYYSPDHLIDVGPSSAASACSSRCSCCSSSSCLLQWWSGAVEYPVMIGGKPLFAFEFATPVTFELSVLLSAFGAVFGMIGLNSDDKFFIAIEARDPKYDLERTRRLLEATGATFVEEVED
jgi:hypothetical protein